jgi:ketosteroid isomerase-like protein
MSDLKQLATQYFETFSRKDLDSLADMFTDTAVLRDWTGSADGKANVLTANKNIFDSVDSITVTPLALYEDGNTVSAEIEVLINNDLKLLVVDIITFENNKISSLRAYKG